MIYNSKVCSIEDFTSAISKAGLVTSDKVIGLKVSVFENRVEIEWHDVDAPKKEPKRSPLVKVAEKVIEKFEASGQAERE